MCVCVCDKVSKKNKKTKISNGENKRKGRCGEIDFKDSMHSALAKGCRELVKEHL